MMDFRDSFHLASTGREKVLWNGDISGLLSRKYKEGWTLMSDGRSGEKNRTVMIPENLG